MDCTGKVALVTGGARRVGRAISLALAEAGADVVVHHHTSVDAARSAGREIERLGRRALLVQADLSQSAGIEQLIATVEAEVGRLDVLVNSAARFDSARVLDITEADWDRVMAVNLKAPFLLSQRAAPLLSADGAGVIINIADLSAFQAWPSYAHHAVSKAGLVHLTRVLARALAPAIRVNCIAPGTVLPPEHVTAPGDDDERRVTSRPGAPEDVAQAVLFLVRSDFVTGEVVRVDGGRMLL